MLLVASVDVRRKRKYMFCVDSYRLKVLLGDLFEGLRQCHHCHLRANMNLDVVFSISERILLDRVRSKRLGLIVVCSVCVVASF